MKYEFSTSFSRQFQAIKSKELALNVITIIELVSRAETARDIPNIKKLKGHKTAFRIRIGDYRIGVFIESNEVFFTALFHRKDIYKRFP
ncbi:MAG: type II toxin-antitoxin system RelE/ParE family toxin [Bacteroidales bacterium]|nr:type II toxin-antitoxin system RelE/ParE family toxin [Bacteroidales bacterium]